MILFTEKISILRSQLYKTPLTKQPLKESTTADGNVAVGGTSQPSRSGRPPKPTSKLIQSNEINDLRKKEESQKSRNGINKHKREVLISYASFL
jgi:hypothetical protein